MSMFGGSGLVERAPDALDQHLQTQADSQQLLADILEQLENGSEQVAITDEARDPVLQKDFPVEGISRWVIHRIAVGGHQQIAAGALSDVLPQNPNRFGGTIVNSGANNVVLKLAKAATAKSQGGIAEIWLAAGGGSWDFRLGNMLWCGNICAEGEGGESTLRIVEV